MILPITSDYDGALREATAALGELRGHDEPVFTALAAFCVAATQMSMGRYDEALRHLREACALSDRAGSDWLPACSRVQMAVLAVLRGKPDEGRPLLEEALDLSLAAHSAPLVALCISAHGQHPPTAGRGEVR